MKFSLLLLAAAVGTATAASAQNAPSQTTPRNPNTTTGPSSATSGTPAGTTATDGPVSAGEAFTKGAPDNTKMRDKRMNKKDKSVMSSDGKGKMKAKM